MKKRVRVHLASGQTLDGLLVNKRGKWLRLFDASYVESAERSIAMEGHIAIPREQVLYVQELS